MKTWISEIFCKHEYFRKRTTQKEGFLFMSFDTLYCFEKCKKEKWVNSSFDRINVLSKEEKIMLVN